MNRHGKIHNEEKGKTREGVIKEETDLGNGNGTDELIEELEIENIGTEYGTSGEIEAEPDQDFDGEDFTTFLLQSLD